MIRFRHSSLAAALLIGISCAVHSPEARAQRFELVWSDEFDGNSLDTGTWVATFATAFNNELQFYTNRSQNLRVRDGSLWIIGLRERYQNRDWTSARIRTQNRMDFRYGKVYLRAKVPGGRGLWPAFWMLPTYNRFGGWPYSGEIDIMEFRGHEPDRYQQTVHFSRRAYPGSGNALADRHLIGGEFVLPEGDSLTTWREYGLEWDAEGIRWFLDGEEVYRVLRTQVEAASEVYPFDEPFHLILNLAIGGNYLGDAQPDATTPDTSVFEVDWVRLYQDVNTAPVVELGQSVSGEVASGAVVPLGAEVSDADGTVDSVAFFLDGMRVALFSEPPYRLDWMAGIDGCYRFSTTAWDNDGGVREVSASEDLVVGTGCRKAPYGDRPIPVPGLVRLAEYDLGGEGVSYHDVTPMANTGGAYRPYEAVDLFADPLREGNVLVGEFEAGEWVEVTVDVAEGGVYEVVLRTLSDDARGRVDLIEGERTLASFSRINESCGDGFEAYRCRTRGGIELAEGMQTLRVSVGTDPGFVDGLVFRLLEATSTGDGSAGGGGAFIPGTRPSEFRLHPNIPNPFNPATTLRFDFPEASRADLAVYDALGRRVATLLDGRALPAGSHDAVFDASGLPSGLYIARLRTTFGERTLRMTLLE